MARRPTGNAPASAPQASAAPEAPRGTCCAVCGAGDARTLTVRSLASGEAVVLCGSHALVLERLPAGPADAAALERALADRREAPRRGEVYEDELAARLFDAFTTERRGADRRAGSAA